MKLKTITLQNKSNEKPLITHLAKIIITIALNTRQQ